MPGTSPSGDSGLFVACVHPSRSLPDVDFETLTRHVMDAERCRWTYVGVILADREYVHRLNREYLQHDYPTDVLSFVIDRTESGLEGEVYVDLDTAEENAYRFDVPYAREVARYVIHGLLHLAGHDDATPDRREAMRHLEDRFLAAIDDPSDGSG